jgi:predicted nucleotidyltransferase
MIVATESLALKVIKEYVNELSPESSILLFGSRARHDNNADSNYDLLIITNEIIDSKELRLMKTIIRKKLAHEKIPVDIIIQNKDEFE